MFKCKYCNEEFENAKKVAAHTKWCKQNPNRGSGVLKIKHRFCAVCGKEIIWDKKHRSKVCDNENCKKEIKKHSEEVKKILSKKRKKWLKDHPELHPWKNNKKFISKPCEQLKNILQKNNILFEKEFNPIEDRFFSIDIFIPSKNIGLEINGNQHYTQDGNLKEYYQNRHNIIEKHGIKLIEIHYAMIYNNNFIVDLLEFIKNEKEINIDEYKKDIRLSKKQKIIEQKKHKENKEKEKIQERIQKIQNMNINFSKLGWNTKVAKTLQISNTQVRRFMKKYMPDFYSKCFVRKSCINN